MSTSLYFEPLKTWNKNLWSQGLRFYEIFLSIFSDTFTVNLWLVGQISKYTFWKILTRQKYLLYPLNRYVKFWEITYSWWRQCVYKRTPSLVLWGGRKTQPEQPEIPTGAMDLRVGNLLFPRTPMIYFFLMYTNSTICWGTRYCLLFMIFPKWVWKWKNLK